MTSFERRSQLRERLGLMLITDSATSRLPLATAVGKAAAGGVTAVMVREPGLSARALLALCGELRRALEGRDVTLIVNDRIDVAVAARADGVHLKRSSLPPRAARDVLGPDPWIGVSTHTEAEVDEAFEEGADYVVFGPIFPTPSKEGIFDPRGPERFARIAARAPGPVLALGGISEETLSRFAPGTVAGVALIRAILGQDDPELAARRLRNLLDQPGRPT